MKVEVGYAYYEGDAQVWDTLYVPIRRSIMEEDGLGPAAVAHLAQEAALLLLEQRDDPDPIVGTFLIGIDEDCAVECSECGSYEARLEKGATGSGDVFFPNLMIGEDGSVDGIYYNLDASGGRLTDKEVIRCERCGHRGTFAEFVNN